ncbi:MAG: 50S ribosomal protein L24 [Rhodocyclaceae bacterium]
MSKIRKGDEVVVLAGKDKGKRGTVLRVSPKDDRLIIEGVNRVKKHTKPNPIKGQVGGIVEREMPIHVSNVAVFNPATQKADRIGYKTLENGTKVRVFKSNGEQVGA